MPFVAIDILRARHEANVGRKRITRCTGISHSFPHDLESIFYVFCWICIVITGPNFTPRPRSDNVEFGTEAIPNCFPSSSSHPNYAVLVGYKESCVVLEENFLYSVLDSFHSYFGQPFPHCACTNCRCHNIYIYPDFE